MEPLFPLRSRESGRGGQIQLHFISDAEIKLSATLLFGTMDKAAFLLNYLSISDLNLIYTHKH